MMLSCSVIDGAYCACSDAWGSATLNMAQLCFNSSNVFSKFESRFDRLDSKIDRMMLVNVALILVFGFSMTYFAQLK
jgi:hypothetical protein